MNKNRSSSSVLVDDLVEVLKSESFVGLGFVGDIDTVHHFHDVFISKVFSDEFGNLLELIKTYFSRLLLVIQVEHSLDPIPCFHFACFLADDLNKLVEVQDFVLLPQRPYDIVNVRVSVIKSHILQDFDNFLRVDGSTAVLIEKQEDVPQLFVLLWRNSFFPGRKLLLGFLLGSFSLGNGFGLLHLIL